MVVRSIVGVVSALGLAACSGTSSHSGASGNGAAPPKGIVGQTLTLQFGPPISLNPALAGVLQSDIDYAAPAYDSLTYAMPNGNIVPDLAKSWSYAPNSNFEQFDMTIRSGVTFSDGTPLTPQAVINSIHYYKGVNGPQAFELSSFTGGKVTGKDTLRLNFSSPEPDLPFLLCQYEGVGQIIGPKGIADPASLKTSSDGTGPYVLSANQSVANSQYVYTANSHYWNPQAVHYKKVAVKVILDPQTGLSAVESGQVDALTIEPTTIRQAAKAADLTTLTAPFSVANMYLMKREPGSPLANLDVRKAINLAIDRPALAKAIGGFGAQADDEPALPGTPGYVKSLENAYPYDPSQAKKLLEKAGYGSGFTMSVLDNDGLDPNGDVGTAIKSNLARIGINVDLTVVPSPAQSIPDALSKKFDAQVWPTAQAGVDYYWAVRSSQLPSYNPFGITDPRFSGLLQKLATASTQNAQVSMDNQITTFLVDNAWDVPVFSEDSLFVAKPGIHIPAPTASNDTIDPIGTTSAQSWYPTASR